MTFNDAGSDFDSYLQLPLKNKRSQLTIIVFFNICETITLFWLLGGPESFDMNSTIIQIYVFTVR